MRALEPALAFGKLEALRRLADQRAGVAVPPPALRHRLDHVILHTSFLGTILVRSWRPCRRAAFGRAHRRALCREIRRQR